MIKVRGRDDKRGQPHGTNAIFVSDSTGTITFVNQAFENRFGWAADRVVGASLETLDDQLPERAEQLTDQLDNGDAVRGEVSHECPDGDHRWYLFEAIRIDRDGTNEVLGVYTDITDRERATRKNELVAELSQAIGGAKTYLSGLEMALETICQYTEWAAGEVWTPVSTADGEVLEHTLSYTDDPQLERFLEGSRSVGLARGEGLPGRVYHSHSPEWIPDVTAASAAPFVLADLAAATGVRAVVGVPVIANEAVVAVLVFALNEPRERDEQLAADVASVGASLGDLIERKQVEALRKEQNELLEQFADVVSHDLRNPLNVAIASLEMVREQGGDHNPYLDDVSDAHDRMEALITELLTLAKQGTAIGEMEAVDLAAMAERCWQPTTAQSATVAIKTDHVLVADESRLRQLLENVFQNAVHHGGSDVTVTVGSVETGFYIEDDGAGIPESEREQVLEPGHTTADEGTGFGLAIVREVVAAHGWRLTVTESDTGGARFEITDVELVTEAGLCTKEGDRRHGKHRSTTESGC